MNKYEGLFQRIVVEGNYKGVRFSDAKFFLEKSGFSVRNNGGDHFIYSMDGVPELVNLQPDQNDHKMAKDYQIKQVRNIFRKYKIGGESDEQ